MKYTKFRDIPQLTREGAYEVNVDLEDVERQIQKFLQLGLDMNPDFQRGHVWDMEQRVCFMEYLLRGGKQQNIIYFNCPWWQHGSSDGANFVIVDGLQRLTTARMFLADEFPVFGSYFSEYVDIPRSTQGLRFNVNDLPTKRDVVQWYININSNGTPHSQE